MYTRITPTKNGIEAIQYARGGKDGKGHNDHEKRNLLIGGVNLLPDSVMPYEDQMNIYWKKASPKHKIQIRRIVGSFSKKELPPEDENSRFKAMEMATQFAESFYPDRQAAIFIQDDGVGGCIHFHLLVNDCSMTDGKGCDSAQQKFWYVQNNFDKMANEYIDLDPGNENAKDKITQTERKKRETNKEAEKSGEPGKVVYIWRDDLKARVKQSMAESIDREDFLRRLTKNGVEGEYRHSSKFGDYVIYELVDTSGFNGNIPKGYKFFKSKSYKMGTLYDLEELDKHIEENRCLLHGFNNDDQKELSPVEDKVTESSYSDLGTNTVIKEDIHHDNVFNEIIVSNTDNESEEPVLSIIESKPQRKEELSIKAKALFEVGMLLDEEMNPDIMREFDEFYDAFE